MSSDCQRYPFFVTELADAHRVIGPKASDLKLKEILKLLVEAKSDKSWSDTLIADELEDGLRLSDRQHKVDTAIARVRALAGHRDNIWRGKKYKPGKSPLIVLHCTYWAGTGHCFRQFIERGFDTTFLVLVYGVICRGFLSKVEEIRRASLEAMDKVALVNFVDRIFSENTAPTKPYDYEASEPLFAKTLKSLRPKVVLNLGSKGHRPFVERAAKLMEIPCLQGTHPSGAIGSTRMEALAEKWEEVRAACPYLT